MDLYTFAAVLGGGGLVAMAAMGAAHLGGDHGGDHSGGHDVGHDAGDHTFFGDAGGPAVGHVSGVGHDLHGVGHHEVSHAASHDTSHGVPFKHALLSLMSPRVLFSMVLGFGAIGLLLEPLVARLFVLPGAIVGGIAFERILIRPLWNFMLRFASKPARTLDSAIMTEVTAVTTFDATGHGLVLLEIDGQIVQCLAVLRAEDRDLGVRVRVGDQLRVEEVDPFRNQCTVAYVGHTPIPSSSPSVN